MTRLKNGVCPSCGSEQIRSGATIEGKEGLHGGNRIPINAVITVALDNYVCVECGYVESYISDRDILKRIANEWSKVEPNSEES